MVRARRRALLTDAGVVSRMSAVSAAEKPSRREAQHLPQHEHGSLSRRQVLHGANGQQVHEKISAISSDQPSFRFQHVRVPLPVDGSGGTFTLTAGLTRRRPPSRRRSSNQWNHRAVSARSRSPGMPAEPLEHVRLMRMVAFGARVRQWRDDKPAGLPLSTYLQPWLSTSAAVCRCE